MASQARKPTRIAPANPHEAYDAVADEIASVDAESLVPISVDIPHAVGIVLGAADRLQSLTDQMRALPGFDLDAVLRIRTYAAACLHAHLVATRRRRSDPTLSAARAEGAKLRADLLKSAELLAHFGVFDAQRVATIRSGTGHVDMANDLVELAEVYRERWSTAQAMAPVSREMVDRAAVLGLELHARLGARRGSEGNRKFAAHSQSTRIRAFTLLVRMYAQCRRAVAYLRWTQGDAESIAPSHFIKRRRGSAQRSAVEPIRPEPIDVSPPIRNA
jgi:hypothetical protein